METRRPTSRALLWLVLRRTVAVFRADWPFLFVLAVLVFAPLGALDFALDLVAEHDIGVAFVLVGVTAVVSALIGEVFYSGTVAALIAKTRPGEQPSLRNVARELRYVRLISADLLVALVIVVGLLLLVVPGVLFFAWFAFVAPVIEIEDRTVRGAFRRSRELVRGRFWIVLAVVGLLEIASEGLIAGIEALAHALLGEGLVVETTASVLGEVLANPLYAVVIVLMAVELMRERPAPSGV
jgi:hypothetical protein